MMRFFLVLTAILSTLSEIQTVSCFTLRGTSVSSPRISTNNAEAVRACGPLEMKGLRRLNDSMRFACYPCTRNKCTILSASADKDMQEKEKESQPDEKQIPSDAKTSPKAIGNYGKSDKIETEIDPIVDLSELGGFDPSKKLPMKREVLVGNPQLKIKKKEKSVTDIMQELAAIQQKGPRKYCILGTRHCSYLHQQIIELLSYALVLSENHVYTSGAGGTNAAAIKGALRAERPDLLTVILPQSLEKQPDDIQEILRDVTDLITMPQNDEMNLDVASRICNSKLLSETDQLIAFAFHESKTVIEARKEAKKLEMLVTMLYLD